MMQAGALDRHGGLTADIALPLGRHFGTSAQCLVNLQAGYDPAVAQAALGPRLVTEVRPGDYAERA
jgi:plasmid maintenance system antidote protein VapI